MYQPRPELEATNSPITAPVIEKGTAIRSPVKMKGSDAGTRTCRTTRAREAPMMRASCRCSSAMLPTPAKVWKKTTKKDVMVAMPTLEGYPMPRTRMKIGAIAMMGTP